MVRRTGVLAFCLFLLFVLAGCEPRGETKTLSEVLEGAKRRFAESMRSGVGSDEAGKQLSDLNSAIEALQVAGSGDEQIRVAGEIISHIDSLMGHAGYTSRPSLAELLKQYQSISDLHDDEKASQASIRLLAARTYALLARELETTRFQL